MFLKPSLPAVIASTLVLGACASQSTVTPPMPPPPPSSTSSPSSPSSPSMPSPPSSTSSPSSPSSPSMPSPPSSTSAPSSPTLPTPPSTSTGEPASSPTSPGQPSSASVGAPGTPDWTPPGQDSADADAETLSRASEQLARASEAVAGAREDIAEAAQASGEPGAEARAAEAALEKAESALGEASERLAEAAAGGGDPEALNEAVSAAEEALAAAEEALAAAREAGSAGPSGAEEALAGAEDAAAGGGGEDLPGAEDSQASGASGPPTVVVAVAGAQGSLDQAQAAIAGAVRALIITGVYLPPGGAEGENQGLPPGGILVLMPGEPGADERVAELEGELEGSLVVFDGRLLEERNRLARQRTGTGTGLPGSDEVTDPGSEAAALLKELGEGGPGADGEAPVEEVQGGDVASVDDIGQGKKETNTIRPSDIPDGVPDGADDDIVARQIREAAMNETDPVLREKLWREYINYKKGGG